MSVLVTDWQAARSAGGSAVGGTAVGGTAVAGAAAAGTAVAGDEAPATGVIAAGEGSPRVVGGSGVDRRRRTMEWWR